MKRNHILQLCRIPGIFLSLTSLALLLSSIPVSPVLNGRNVLNERNVLNSLRVLAAESEASGKEETKPGQGKETSSTDTPGRKQEEQTSSTDTPESETQEQASSTEKLRLSLDTEHVYDFMDSSYTEGYIPTVEKDTVHLAVPFLAEGPLKGSSLTVALEMGQDAPFLHANYQKQVEKKTFSFADGTQTEAFLYLCDLKLDTDYSGGKYPVTVTATGYSDSGEQAELSYRIFITLPEKKNRKKDKEEKKGEESPDSGIPGPSSEDLAFDSSQDSVPVMGEGATDTSETEEVLHQPKLILVSNSLLGKRVGAGKSKKFVTEFQNTSKQETICNLKITLKAADEAVSLKTASFYFDAVAPGETISLPTSVSVSPAAEQKKVSVDFTFEYENDKGTAYTGTDAATLEISQSVQVSLEGFQLPAQVASLETVSAAMQVRNTGRAPVYNVKVSLNAPGLFPVGTVFGGNLEAGASYDGAMQIYIGNKSMTSMDQTDAQTGEESYGSTAGTLTLTYEDAYGKAYTQTQEFSTVIQKPALIKLEVKKEETKSSPWWIPVLVLLILLFVSILAWMGRRLKKSRDKLADLLARREESGES